MTIPYNEEKLKEKMEEIYHQKMEEFENENNTEEALEESLNDSHGEVEICGYSFQQGSAYRELDPIGFRCALSDESDRFYEMFAEENQPEDFEEEALEELDMEEKN